MEFCMHIIVMYGVFYTTSVVQPQNIFQEDG